MDSIVRGTHREQAHFDRAKWRKRVLLPCWIIQLPILLVLVALFCYRLSTTVATYKEQQDKGNVPAVDFIWECANIAFSAVSFIINMVQIAKFIAEALTPFAMLSGNVVGFTFSIAILVLDILVYSRDDEGQYSAIALGLDIVLLVFTVIPCVYGIVVYRRIMSYDDYHHPHHNLNVKHYGFSEANDFSYDPRRMSLNIDPTTTVYEPTTPPEAHQSRLSFKMGRSTSERGSRTSLVLEEAQTPMLERRQSYDHKRDTQFDEYVARRSSVSLQQGVEQALSKEFGRGQEPVGRAVSAGTMGSVPARSVSNPGSRASSWEVNLGQDIVDGTGVQRGHSLICVPEVHEADEEGGPRWKGKGKAKAPMRHSYHPGAPPSPASTFESNDNRFEYTREMEGAGWDWRTQAR
ncbi:hypothetical protein BX600DRAFT_203624 [Xylariales sp. PMI_506]|nr:hypothetical protein BX600DRAFT_203624 [Xylariales sp. PMI_506]